GALAEFDTSPCGCRGRQGCGLLSRSSPAIPFGEFCTLLYRPGVVHGAPVAVRCFCLVDVGAALIDVLEPQDVLLTEIAADLHLDQFERDLPGIGEAMHCADRYIGRFVLMVEADALADRYFGDAAYHHPVLGAVEVLLQR